MGREAEEAALFACSKYYVNSPLSSVVNVNPDDLLLLPYHSSLTKPQDNAASACWMTSTLSRCSSSRASTASQVPPESRIMMITKEQGGVTTSKIFDSGDKFRDGEEGDQYQDHYDYEPDNIVGCCSYFSFTTYPSLLWFAIQLSWRFLLSFLAALLVFYIATKPPAPLLSVKMTEIKEFKLAEGVDSYGVATNLLSCNISVTLVLENKSKVYCLGALSPVMEIYFGRVPLVFSQGRKVKVGREEEREIKLYGGTRNKAMYGGGRNMEDMLNSRRGLPLFISISFTSYFPIVGNLLHPKFHHHAHCSLFIIHNSFKWNSPPHSYNTTCTLTS